MSGDCWALHLRSLSITGGPQGGRKILATSRIDGRKGRVWMTRRGWIGLDWTRGGGAA